MKRVTKAVMGCNKNQPIAINSTAIKVKTNMTLNAALFTGTSAAVTALGVEQGTLAGFIGTAKGNHTIIDQRNVQAVKVYGMLQALLFPVNTVANGNVATIDLSGFPSSLDSNPQAVPGKVSIKKIVPGVTELSAKIHIDSLKQSRLTYTVRTTTVAGAGVNDPSWVTVLQTHSSLKLILTGLIYSQTLYISVNAFNSHGVGVFSDTVSFRA